MAIVTKYKLMRTNGLRKVFGRILIFFFQLYTWTWFLLDHWFLPRVVFN